MSEDERLQSNYPRAEKAKPLKNWWGVVASLGLVVMAFFSCAGAGAQLMAEGPQPPDGRITNSPYAIWFALPCFGISVALVGFAIWLTSHSLGWRRKK